MHSGVFSFSSDEHTQRVSTRPKFPISYNGESACARSSRAARAKVAELVDALDLGSSGETRAGSSPAFRMFLQIDLSQKI